MAWSIDPAHTSVGFSVKHLGLSTVRGRFTGYRGDIDLANPTDPTAARGRVEIDVASIDTGNQQRDEHLRTGDFFEVAAHPTIVFELKSVTPRGGDEYTVVGDLTIKGVTRAVTLDYEHGGLGQDHMGNTKLGGSLSGAINRSDWGLRWDMPLGGGGLVIGERIKIDVDGQLVQTEQALAA